jgi:hypothetical protein
LYVLGCGFFGNDRIVPVAVEVLVAMFEHDLVLLLFRCLVYSHRLELLHESYALHRAELVSVGRYEALCVAQGGFISRTRPYKVELKLGGFGRFSRRVKVGQQMILGYGNKHSGAVQATFV